MRYEILGPIRLIDRGDEFRLSSAKADVLLATLAIRTGQVVPTSQLLTELWPEASPVQAAGAVHVYISQLRKLIRRPGSSTSVIKTCSPGYVLQTTSDEFDFLEFWEGMRRGRELLQAGAALEAADVLDEAINHWRGTSALGGLRGGPVVDGFAAWIEESRLECLELRIEANLIAQRHRLTVSDLYSLVAEYPLRESLYRLLMLALYFSDRQVDALSVYQTARAVVREELGVEPCQSLRDLQHAILAEDPDLRSALTQRPGAGPAARAGQHPAARRS